VRGARAQIFARTTERSTIFGKEVYFLVNGRIEGAVGDLEKSWDHGLHPIVPIATRGLAMLEHEALSLALHYYQKHLPPSVRGIYVSRTPDRGVDLDFEKREFPREGVVRLFRAGCQWGWNMNPWPVWNSAELPAHPYPYPPTSWQDPAAQCVAPSAKLTSWADFRVSAATGCLRRRAEADPPPAPGRGHPTPRSVTRGGMRRETPVCAPEG